MKNILIIELDYTRSYFALIFVCKARRNDILQTWIRIKRQS